MLSTFSQFVIIWVIDFNWSAINQVLFIRFNLIHWRHFKLKNCVSSMCPKRSQTTCVELLFWPVFVFISNFSEFFTSLLNCLVVKIVKQTKERETIFLKNRVAVSSIEKVQELFFCFSSLFYFHFRISYEKKNFQWKKIRRKENLLGVFVRLFSKRWKIDGFCRWAQPFEGEQVAFLFIVEP